MDVVNLLSDSVRVGDLNKEDREGDQQLKVPRIN